MAEEDSRPPCAHCGRRVTSDGALPLCNPAGTSLPFLGPNCTQLVLEFGHPMPCEDCDGLMGPELGWPGLAWMARRFELDLVDEMVRPVQW